MNKNILLTIVASFALLQSPVARSDSEDVIQLIANNLAAAADSIKQVASVEAMQAALEKVIQSTTDSFMKQADTSSQKEIAAQGVVGDGISQTGIDTFNQETVFWMTPDIGTCDRKKAKGDLGTASKQQEILRAKVSAAVAGQVRGSSNGGSTKITPLKVHDQLFCAPADVDRQYCNSASQYPDFDLSAANFMQPKNNTYNPTEKKAAAQFIVNTIVPTPVPQLPKNYKSDGSPEVQKFREAHNAYAGRMNTAIEALSDVFADNSAPNDLTDSKGVFRLIKEQVEGRAMADGGVAFTTALTKGGPGTAARAAAEMESMTNLLLFKIWESERRQQVLLGQMQSMLAQQDMGIQISERQKAAGSSAVDAPKNN